MAKRAPSRRKVNGTTLAPPARPWWGDEGPPPDEQWPGVTIRLPAVWVNARDRWESPDGVYYFDETEAARAVAFFPTFLRHHIGEFNGRPFELLPYQEKLLTRPLFGWKRAADGLRRFRKVFAFIPKGAGKALAVDTPIPTPDGWISMGDLRVGDRVIGEDGRPRTILHVSETWSDRDCYAVRFSDGAEIVASAEHLWKTTAQRNGKSRQDQRRRPKIGEPDIVSTADIARTLKPPPTTSKHPQAQWNHRVDVAKALDLPDRELPIPPYTLGAWLGDGDSDCARITVGDGDVGILAEIRADGVEVRTQKSGTSAAGRYSIGAGPRGGDQALRRAGLLHRLRSLGLLGNKHIPPAYLRASLRQRLALLQGLMDTDGTIAANGSAEFTVMSEVLATGVADLIFTLGMKVQMRSGQAKIRGRVVGTRYRLLFRPVLPVFRLERKAARVKAEPATRMLSASRRIVACRHVESVPVRCITIDGSDGMFLAGRQMVPTHNSPWAAGTGLYLLFCDNEAAAEVYAIASDKLQARTVHDNAKIMVEQSPHLAGRAEVLRDAIYVPATRSTYQVLAAEALSAHGKRPHAVILDEFHTQRNRDLFEAFRKSLAKRRQPVLVLITHAGDDDESICYEEYELAKQVLSGTHPDPTCLPVIFEADPVDDWTAPATWRKVNPGHGITIQHDGIVTEALEASAEPRKLNDFLRFHLNRWTNSSVAWIPVDWWDGCAGPLPPLEVLAECPVAVGIDLSQKYDLTAVVAAFRLPLDDTVPEADVEVVATDEAGVVVRRSLSLNYRIALVPAFWLPDDTLDERVRHDRVPYDLYRDLGELRTTAGAVIDSDAVVSYITDELAVRYPLVKSGDLGYDPAFATELSIRLQARGFKPVELLQNFKQLSEASQVFEALVKARRVIHGGHRLLRWQLENTTIKRDDAGRIRPVKPRKAAKRIDGIVASIMAINRLLVQTPAPPPPRYQMIIY